MPKRYESTPDMQAFVEALGTKSVRTIADYHKRRGQFPKTTLKIQKQMALLKRITKRFAVGRLEHEREEAQQLIEYSHWLIDLHYLKDGRAPPEKYPTIKPTLFEKTTKIIG